MGKMIELPDAGREGTGMRIIVNPSRIQAIEITGNTLTMRMNIPGLNYYYHDEKIPQVLSLLVASGMIVSAEPAKAPDTGKPVQLDLGGKKQ